MIDYRRVAGADEIPAGTMKLVDVGGERFAIANVDGSFHAFSDDCTHDGGPLSEGELEGALVTCPWHFSRFDIRNGEVIDSPAYEAIRTYAVRVEDGTVYVGVDTG